MTFSEFNIVSILSIAISAVSLFFFFYTIIFKPFKKSSIHFTVFSFFTFIVTISAFFTLSASNYNFALYWTYILVIGVFLLPVSQLILLLEFIEYKSFGIRNIYKYLIYLIPVTFIVFLSLTNNINTEKSLFGFIVSIRHIRFLLPIYLIIFNVFIALLLFFEIYRRKKSNISIKGLTVFLMGIIVFILGQTIYQLSFLSDLIIKIPSNIISVIFLYLFILVSIYIVRTATHKISLTKAFEDIQDCLIISDYKGDILEFNKSMKKVFLDENNAADNNFSSKIIKSKVSELISNKDKSIEFLNFLEGNSTTEFKCDVTVNNNSAFLIYNISAYPILDRSGRILGRVSIFKDITKQKQYEKEVEFISFHDKLTGLYNRYYFEEELKRLDTQRQLPISIIMADVDGLKNVNDRFGHSLGDKLIIEVANLLKDSCRKEDIIARWGGDEFIIFLPKTSEESALEVLNRIIEAYHSQKLDDEINISVSLGFATKNEENKNMEAVIEKADKNMYIDKGMKKRS